MDKFSCSCGAPIWIYYKRIKPVGWKVEKCYFQEDVFYGSIYLPSGDIVSIFRSIKKKESGCWYKTRSSCLRKLKKVAKELGLTLKEKPE